MTSKPSADERDEVSFEDYFEVIEATMGLVGGDVIYADKVIAKIKAGVARCHGDNSCLNVVRTLNVGTVITDRNDRRVLGTALVIIGFAFETSHDVQAQQRIFAYFGITRDTPHGVPIDRQIKELRRRR